MSLIKRVKSPWIDLPDWPILSVMQVSSSAILLSILSSVSLLACGDDAAETPDARIDTPRADARTTPLPDARIFPPFVDAMPLPDAGPECDDPSEPNDTENTSTVLADITDCDGTGGTVSGAADADDEDWYSYTAEDVFNDGILTCSVDPTVSIATGNVEVCLFLSCTDKETEFTCPDGTTATTVGTIEGCCSTSGFTVDDLNCLDTFSEDATNFIRVKSASQDSCETYSVGFHY